VYSLDSSAFRLLYQRNSNMVQKVKSVPLDHIFLSAIVVQEALAGRLAPIKTAAGIQSRSGPDMMEKAYAELFETLELIRPFSLISYTKEDELAFRQLPAKVKRVRAQDCRIGVQAQRRGLIVVTQNIADFAAAGFVCEDWSVYTND
jgi:predicted nucleic acid-binding protein